MISGDILQRLQRTSTLERGTPVKNDNLINTGAITEKQKYWSRLSLGPQCLIDILGVRLGFHEGSQLPT